MIENMVQSLGSSQRRSLVARLAAAWRVGLAALASGAPLGSALLAQCRRWRAACSWWCCQAPPASPRANGDAVPQGRVLPHDVAAFARTLRRGHGRNGI